MFLFSLLVSILLFPGTGRGLTVCNPFGQTEGGVYVDVLLKLSSGREMDVPRTERETIRMEGDVVEVYNRLFMARGWGDGLPMIPPTPERVEAMVAGYDLPGDIPVAGLAPMRG